MPAAVAVPMRVEHFNFFFGVGFVVTAVLQKTVHNAKCLALFFATFDSVLFGKLVMDIQRPSLHLFNPVHGGVHGWFLTRFNAEGSECAKTFKQLWVKDLALHGKPPSNKLTPPVNFLTTVDFVFNVFKKDNGMSGLDNNLVVVRFECSTFRLGDFSKPTTATVHGMGTPFANKNVGELTNINPTSSDEPLFVRGRFITVPRFTGGTFV